MIAASGIEHALSSHGAMLGDPVRVAALDRAIRASVRPGDVAIDLGCGTGLLSLMALRAGARKVYAIDSGRVIEHAEEVVRASRVGDRITLIRGRSDAIQLPEKADVLIGYVAFDDGLLSSFADARSRLLKPDARVIPNRIQLVGALVSAEEAHARRVGIWSSDAFDLSGIEECACQQPYLVETKVDDIRSDQHVLLDVDLTTVSRPFVKGNARFTVHSDGILHGVGGWLRAEHCPGDWLSSVPPSQVPTWRSFLFPFRKPSTVKKGDFADVTLSSHDGRVWRWQVTMYGEGDAAVSSIDHSTFSGFPIATSARSRSPFALQRLTPLGRAAAFALGRLADGASDALAAALVQAFPDVLPSLGAAKRLIEELEGRCGIQ